MSNKVRKSVGWSLLILASIFVCSLVMYAAGPLHGLMIIGGAAVLASMVITGVQLIS